MFMKSSSGFEKLLDKATSPLLIEPDWHSILQICDLIRQDDIQPHVVLNGIKKRLQPGNSHTTLFTLQLLESVVENCGNSVYDELTSKVYCDMLHELAKTTPHDNVKQKLLELIQTWNYAFRKNPNLKDLMNTMKSEGFKFPVVQESDAMFKADTAPKWTDGEVCHHCRVQFGMVLRKHYCRACGQVFCSQCSQKSTNLPKFGIEKEVRVCDVCYDQYTKPSSIKTFSEKESDLPIEYLKSSLAQQSQAPPQKIKDELLEAEELQLALALSHSEFEAKENEKLRATSASLNTYKKEGNEAEVQTLASSQITCTTDKIHEKESEKSKGNKERFVDDDQIFGDYVASSLRSLKFKENNIKLRRIIQRTILEIQELDDNNFVPLSADSPD